MNAIESAQSLQAFRRLSQPVGRLALPDVTLLSFDPVDPVAALRSLIWSRRHADFQEIVLVTRKGKQMSGYCDRAHVRLIELDGIPLARREGYELYHLQHLPEWFRTSHVLYQEADGGVLNPQAWDPDWMLLDFMGAPWPYPMNEPDYPACTKENCVGNGGFSLRSMKLCGLLQQFLKSCFSGDNNLHGNVPQRFISDAWIGRTMRPALEQQGMLFASHAEAERFSCENRVYGGQLGYHGHTTAQLNGWHREALKLL